jgi:hypothetical protein
MKVREAVAELVKLPQELELLDDYAENEVTGFTVSSYDDGSGDHPYVIVEMTEADD